VRIVESVVYDRAGARRVATSGSEPAFGGDISCAPERVAYRERVLMLKARPNQQQEGPWLDRLFPIRMSGGRLASVTAFSVLPTNVGIFEGGLNPRANAIQRRKILALAKERFGDPIIVVEPHVEPLHRDAAGQVVRERYPWMACMARLTSKALVEDDFNVSSKLTLVWWQDTFDAPLSTEIERAAAAVDWDRSARDVEFW
jgi:hypothetical protein